jgi:hypothetical protein
MDATGPVVLEMVFAIRKNADVAAVQDLAS